MNRIHIHPTTEGDEYRKAMEAWGLAGSPPNLKPLLANRGVTSIFQAMKAIDLSWRMVKPFSPSWTIVLAGLFFAV